MTCNFLCQWEVRASWKKKLFTNIVVQINIRNWFFKFVYTLEALNHPIGGSTQKWRVLLVCVSLYLLFMNLLNLWVIHASTCKSKLQYYEVMLNLCVQNLQVKELDVYHTIVRNTQTTISKLMKYNCAQTVLLSTSTIFVEQ